MEITLKELVDIISGGGLVGLLVIILVAGMRGYWVWGWAYKEGIAREQRLREERDEWRDLAIQGMTLADRGVSLAGTATNTTSFRRNQ